uniref:mitogen-activated protein kinase kinase n=1 Tax=Acrobeloides nanus TaxID=290746 RepID=A0A914DRU4_9BILA
MSGSTVRRNAQKIIDGKYSGPDPLLEEFKTMIYERLEELQLPPGKIQLSPELDPIDCTNDDFDFIEKLGEGSFGEVHKVKHIPTGNLMAIKYQTIVFDPHSDEAREYWTRQKIYDRLIREITAFRKAFVSKFTNFIPSYYGMLILEKSVAFCIEVLDLTAENLYHCHKNKKRDAIITNDNNESLHFEEKPLAIVAISILKAMLHLRNLKAMHRDIKPRNILLNFNGDVKLCDLGLVVFLEDSAAISIQSGSKLYLAPEILRGDFVTEYRVKSDVWSLGITLLEMARFRYPFNTDVLEKDLLFQIIAKPVPILNENDGYNEEMTHFINQCLIKDPKQRPHITELEMLELATKFSDINFNRNLMKDFISNNVER